MRATGIVRRIDELGRIVIPKELRRIQRIRSGDFLEIYTEDDGRIVLRRFSAVEELKESADNCADVISKLTGKTVAVCDTQRVIAAAGSGRAALEGKEISRSLERAVEQKKTCFSKAGEGVAVTEHSQWTAIAVAPVLSFGEAQGCVAVLSNEGETPSDADVKLAAAAAGFLGRRAEE